jgi:hypothetical protein
MAHFKHVLHFIFTRNLSLLVRQETHNWTHKTVKTNTYPEINTPQSHISSINITLNGIMIKAWQDFTKINKKRKQVARINTPIFCQILSCKNITKHQEKNIKNS